MPYAHDPGKVAIFVYAFGQLEPEFKLDLTQTENAIVVETESGKAIYHTEDNFVTGLTIERTTLGNGRLTGDVFQSYLD